MSDEKVLSCPGDISTNEAAENFLNAYKVACGNTPGQSMALITIHQTNEPARPTGLLVAIHLESAPDEVGVQAINFASLIEEYMEQEEANFMATEPTGPSHETLAFLALGKAVEKLSDLTDRAIKDIYTELFRDAQKIHSDARPFNDCFIRNLKRAMDEVIGNG